MVAGVKAMAKASVVAPVKVVLIGRLLAFWEPREVSLMRDLRPTGSRRRDLVDRTAPEACKSSAWIERFLYSAFLLNRD